jgi:anti-sigma factor RsiW
MMSEQSANMEPALQEQLVAYLDGELDAETSRRIEGLLASDPKIRQTLQTLDRTWELLDELEKPQVADKFTQSTLEMVIVAAEEDTKQGQTTASRRRLWRKALFGVGLLGAAAIGFMVVSLQPDPNQQLIQDLPILENLDDYLQTDDIQFLRMLREEGVFAEETGDEP